MKEKKSVKSVAKVKDTVAENKRIDHAETNTADETNIRSAIPAGSIEKTVNNRPNYKRIAAIACAGIIFAALIGDNIYLHVEMRRHAQIMQSHMEQISDLCEWVEHASVQGKWNDGKKSVAEFGHSIAEKFRAAGRKTVRAFRKADDKLNPQTESK